MTQVPTAQAPPYSSVQLVVLPDLANVMPPLAGHEFSALEKSIVDVGVVYEPIEYCMLDGKAVIVDGHNRYAIAHRSSIPYTVVQLENVNSVDQAMTYMLEVAPYRRRNLGKRKASYVRGLLFNQRKAQGARYDKIAADISKTTTTSGQNVQKSVAEQIGKAHGVCGKTVQRDGSFALRVRELVLLDLLAATAVLDDECRVRPGDLTEAKKMSASHWSVIIGKMLADHVDLQTAGRSVLGDPCDVSAHQQDPAAASAEAAASYREAPAPEATLSAAELLARLKGSTSHGTSTTLRTNPEGPPWPGDITPAGATGDVGGASLRRQLSTVGTPPMPPSRSAAANGAASPGAGALAAGSPWTDAELGGLILVLASLPDPVGIVRDFLVKARERRPDLVRFDPLAPRPPFPPPFPFSGPG